MSWLLVVITLASRRFFASWITTLYTGVTADDKPTRYLTCRCTEWLPMWLLSILHIAYTLGIWDGEIILLGSRIYKCAHTQGSSDELSAKRTRTRWAWQRLVGIMGMSKSARSSVHLTARPSARPLRMQNLSECFAAQSLVIMIVCPTCCSTTRYIIWPFHRWCARPPVLPHKGWLGLEVDKRCFFMKK